MTNLIVETGANVLYANSYVALSDANTYFQAVGDTAFTSASPNQQSAALVRACYGMGYWLTGRWLGRRANQNQALDWPRMGIRDADNYCVAANQIPPKVIRAQCEIAKIELTTPFIQVKVDREDMAQSLRVGPIDIGYRTNAPSIAYWPQIIAMLQDYAVIGVMPIECVIGISESERHGMREGRDGVFGGTTDVFNFPRYFQLLKEGSFGSDQGQFGE